MPTERWMMRASPALFGVLLALAAASPARDAGSYLVATQTVEPVTYELSLPDKLGVLLAGQDQLLAFEVSGRLTFLEAEGRAVEAGGTLARLEDAQERAQLRRSEVLLEDSLRELRRLRGLRAAQVASAKALDDATTAVELRRAERDEALARLAQRELIAEWSGVIVEHLADPGEVVASSEPIGSLMNLDRLRVELGIPG